MNLDQTGPRQEGFRRSGDIRWRVNVCDWEFWPWQLVTASAFGNFDLDSWWTFQCLGTSTLTDWWMCFVLGGLRPWQLMNASVVQNFDLDNLWILQSDGDLQALPLPIYVCISYCVYVCIYIYIYIYIHIHVHVHMYTCIHYSIVHHINLSTMDSRSHVPPANPSPRPGSRRWTCRSGPGHFAPAHDIYIYIYIYTHRCIYVYIDLVQGILRLRMTSSWGCVSHTIDMYVCMYVYIYTHMYIHV